jgi:hypothetical protein
LVSFENPGVFPVKTAPRFRSGFSYRHFLSFSAAEAGLVAPSKRRAPIKPASAYLYF